MRSSQAGSVSSAFVRLLGPIRFVPDRGETIDLPSPAQRRLLAVLALASGVTQRAEYLSDALGLSAGSLRTTMSRLRSRIGGDVIRTDTTGYRIGCAVDTIMFTDLLVDRPDQPDRLGALEDALALWQGDALDEFRHEPWAAPEVARLEELRALAIEDRAELLITGSRTGEAVAALEAHVAINPLRDRPRGLLIRALACEGRQAEALRAYQDYRSFLADETGTEPSVVVRSIEQRVAAGWREHDDAEGHAGAAPVRPTPEGPASVNLPLHGALVDASVLIGRQREVTWLESDLIAARAGSLRTVLLGGEAGIGKTTLLASFARAHHHQGGNVVVYGRCAEGAAVPLEPFRDVLAELVEHAPLAVLQAHCERWGGELSRVGPELAGRLPAPAPLESDAASEQYQLFEAIADLLRRVASGGSLTLILDDLHWAEPTALLLLRHLGRSLVAAPVLVLAGYRDTDDDATTALRSALADLERGRCRRIPLAGFDDAELTRLIMSITGAGEEPGVDLLVALRDETAGNPLYAAHLVRHLWESGLLSIESGRVGLRGRGLEGALPRSLLEVVWSRVQALGESCAEVLRAASVLGIDFAEEALVAMTDRPAAEVEASLDSAVSARLLDDTGDARRPLKFTHAVIARALYLDLAPTRRRRLHGRAASVLQGDGEFPSPDTVVDLARHSALAGDLTAAQRWAVAAGQHAYEHLAPAEAARWYEMALDYASDRSIPDAERAELMLRLGEAQHHAGDPRSHDTLLTAATLAQHAGARDVLVRAALANDRGFSRPGTPDVAQLAAVEAAIAAADPGDTNALARLLACRAQELVNTTQYDVRLTSAHQAIKYADRSDDPTLLPQMISALVWGLWGPGTLALRRSLAAEAVAAAVESGDLFLQFTTNRAAYYVAIESADSAAATAHLSRIKAIATDIGEPRLRWICGLLEAFEATMEARFDDAEKHSELMFELGTEIGEPDAFSLYAVQLFVNRSFAGRYDEVIPLLEQAIAATPEALPYRLALAISCAAVGRRDEARRCLHEGASAGFANIPFDFTWMTAVIGYAVLAIELQDVPAAAELYPILEPFGDQVAFNGATSQGHVGAYLGKLASLADNHDLADSHLRRSLEVNLAFGWKYHEATTLVALAASQRRRTGTLDARGDAWLDEAASISAERGMVRVAAQVEQLRGGAQL